MLAAAAAVAGALPPMPDSLAEAANAVREEGRSTWAAYYKHARGFDSLRPLSHRGVNDWGSVGMMAIDCLDTLWLMNLTAEFKQARSIVEEIDYTPAGREARSVSTFEMTIRGLGGLLSAHALSGDRLFLRKAEQLGEALNTAFVPGRFPLPSVSLKKPGAGAASLTSPSPRHRRLQHSASHRAPAADFATQ